MKLRKKVYVVTLYQDEILLMQNICYKSNEWSFPGGGIEEGETAKAAAQRECREETGTDVSIIFEDPEPYTYMYPEEFKRTRTLDHDGQHVTLFVGTFTTKDIILDPKEHKAYCWVAKENLKQYLVFPRLYEVTMKTLQKAGVLTTSHH